MKAIEAATEEVFSTMLNMSVAPGQVRCDRTVRTRQWCYPETQQLFAQEGNFLRLFLCPS